MNQMGKVPSNIWFCYCRVPLVQLHMSPVATGDRDLRPFEELEDGLLNHLAADVAVARGAFP